MISIWMAVIIAGITYWIGFLIGAALAACKDMKKEDLALCIGGNP